jgi:hypothetical protein
MARARRASSLFLLHSTVNAAMLAIIVRIVIP